MRGLYWEEWAIGAEFESPGRTVTEADIVTFAGLSGDYNPLHINEEYCKTTQFGTRIAHGPLVYAIAAGLIFQLHLYDDTLIAFLGFDSLKFTNPVKAGDTIHAKLKVLEKRESSRADRGIMKRQLQVFNQRGEMVQDAVQAFLLKRILHHVAALVEHLQLALHDAAISARRFTFFQYLQFRMDGVARLHRMGEFQTVES